MKSAVMYASLAFVLSGCGGEDAPPAGNGGGSASVSAPTPSPSPSPSPTPSPTPTPTPAASTGGGTATRQEQMLAAMLRTHNEARAEVGVPDLRLDQDLSDQALAYAEELASTGRFQHSASGDRPGQGENLWAGTPSAFSFEEMSGAWIDEKRFYIHARFPYVSNTGQWQDVGHYTQIIWRDTTRLGCGIATGSGRDYLVCRYAPPGNVSGQFAY